MALKSIAVLRLVNGPFSTSGVQPPALPIACLEGGVLPAPSLRMYTHPHQCRHEVYLIIEGSRRLHHSAGCVSSGMK